MSLRFSPAACLLLAGVMLTSLAPPLSAAPWSKLFKKVDTDPKKPYKLGFEQGPFLIMACSFSGEGAEDQAHELVMELRTKFRIDAYVFDKVFDFSKGAEGDRPDRFGNPVPKRYQRGGKYKEIAVLAGNFASADDPEAQKTLKELKYARIECMELVPGKKDNRSLGLLREWEKKVDLTVGGNAARLAEKGPLGHAFLTTNPLLPDEYWEQSKLDPLVVKINAPVKYSLLKAPGKYSVRIATFTGGVVVDPKKIKQIEAENKISDRLEVAAERAGKITAELRSRGVEAYEFHDISMSMVCVGSFDMLGTPRADGKLELIPQIVAVMKEYGADVQGTKVGAPKTVAQIPLDIQPQVVEIPRERQITEADRERWRANLEQKQRQMR